MKSAIATLAIALLASLSPTLATPIPVDFKFNGYITSASNDPQFNTVIEANNTLTGYLKFDGGIKATTAGHWNLPNAVFHMEIDKLVIDAVGATADMITPNRDIFTFTIHATSFIEKVPPQNMVQIDAADVTIEFFTFGEYLFSPWNLPIISPPRDQYMVVYVWGDDWSGHAGTDTNFHVTAAPEPASIALLGGGLVWLAARRRRR